MKKTFIKYKYYVIAFLVLFIPLMSISIYQIEYSLIAPGLTDNIDTFLIIEGGYNTENTFHTTSVMVVDKVTVLQYLLGNLDNKITVREFPEYYNHINLDDLNTMDYLMKDNSLSTSIVVGIQNSNYNIDYNSYLTVYLIYDYLSPNSLEIGDKILEVNGSSDLETTLNNIACGDTAVFKIIRDDEILSVSAVNNLHDDETCSFGIYLKYYTEIINKDDRVNIEIVKTNTGGPSGGLMQALFVYYSLTASNIETNLKIAGTGTIDIDGNVGPIGGVEQKIITATLNNIDLFFVPHLSDDDNDNYIKALKVLNTLNTDMLLVGVSTFDEALEFLNNYTRGDSNE